MPVVRELRWAQGALVHVACFLSLRDLRLSVRQVVVGRVGGGSSGVHGRVTGSSICMSFFGWKLVSSSRANFAWSKKSGVDNVFCYFVANPEHVFNRQ